MPSDESKGSQLDAIGSLAQRQLDNTVSAKSGLALTETLGAADVEVDPDNQSLGEP